MNFSKDLSKFESNSKEYIFFQKVLQKLGSNLIRDEVEEKLKETRNNLNKAMKKYFQQHILANAIIKSAEQLQTSQNTPSSSHHFNEPLSDSIHPLYLNYVRQYLPSEEMSQKINLFGLTKENTLRTSQKKSEVEAAVFKKLVERNISDFCIKLIECTGDSVYPGSDWKSTFHRAIKKLESKEILLSSEVSKGQSKKKLREMINTYYEELHKGILLLNRLLTLHEQKLDFESNLAQFYFHRCRAVSLKIRLFEQKILAATYNEETIPALKKISVQLDQTEQKLKEDQAEKTVALEQYLKLGEEYEKFVDEYSHLISSIREQRWAIDELKNKQSLNAASSYS